jgi:hypothetical protein
MPSDYSGSEFNESTEPDYIGGMTTWLRPVLAGSAIRAEFSTRRRRNAWGWPGVREEEEENLLAWRSERTAGEAVNYALMVWSREKQGIQHAHAEDEFCGGADAGRKERRCTRTRAGSSRMSPHAAPLCSRPSSIPRHCHFCV